MTIGAMYVFLPFVTSTIILSLLFVTILIRLFSHTRTLNQQTQFLQCRAFLSEYPLYLEYFCMHLELVSANTIWMVSLLLANTAFLEGLVENHLGTNSEVE